MKKEILIGLFLSSVVLVSAQSSWDNTKTSGDWSDSSNWIGGAPVGSTKVIMPAPNGTAFLSSDYNVNLDANATITQMNVNTGANTEFKISSSNNSVLTIDGEKTEAQNVCSLFTPTATGGSNLWLTSKITFDVDVVISNSTTGRITRTGTAYQSRTLTFGKSLTVNTEFRQYANYKVFINGALNLTDTGSYVYNPTGAAASLTFGDSAKKDIDMGSTGTANSKFVVAGAGNTGKLGTITFNQKNSLAVNSLGLIRNGSIATGTKGTGTFVWNADEAVTFVGSNAVLELGFAGATAANQGYSAMNLQMNGYDQTFGKIVMENSGTVGLNQVITIDMGGNANDGSKLTFADSSAEIWSNGYMLDFTNWDSSSYVKFLGTGLSDEQLLKITIDGVDLASSGIQYGRDAGFLYIGSIIPEPSTCALIIGLSSLGFIAYRKRK